MMKLKIFISIFYLFIISCNSRQSSYLNYNKDTLIDYFHDRCKISKMLDDKYFTLHFSACTAGINCTIYADTTISENLIDSISCKKFIEVFINRYYNHFPLSEKEFNIIRQVIIIAYFGVQRSGKYSYSKSRQFYKYQHVVNTSYLLDSLSRIYKFGLWDTIHNIHSEFKLFIKDNEYQLLINNFPKRLINSQSVNDSIKKYNFN